MANCQYINREVSKCVDVAKRGWAQQEDFIIFEESSSVDLVVCSLIGFIYIYIERER